MSDQTPSPLTDIEVANMRNALNLMRSQVKAQRIDVTFLSRQIDKLSDFMVRLIEERENQGTSGRFAALYEVSRALGSSLDLQTVLNQVMDSIIQLTSAERGFLMLRDDDGNLTVQAARNFDQQTISESEFKYSRTVVNHVMDSGNPILTTNATEDPRFAGQASIVAQALRSIMATPLRARGNVIGVAYVDSRAMSGLFKDEDLDALDAFSGQAAVALDNAMLFETTDQELARRVEQLRQLRRVDLLLNQTLDADQAIAHTLEWACRLSEAEIGYLGLYDADTRRVRTAHMFGVDENEPQPDYLDEAFPKVNDVCTSGEVITYGDDSREYLIAPVHRDQQIIAVVVLIDIDGVFGDEQRDIVNRVVARAAIAIENARLYDAVRSADRAKSEFVGIVAHDLKAPMNNIAGYAELMLMQGGMSDRHSGYLSQIKDTVNRMEMLVSDLADISRIESGHFYMEEIRVPVVGVVQGVQDGTMPQMQAAKHTYIEDVEPGLPDMWVDYYRLLQVLMNLVSNAYKYTPEGGTITLSAKRDGNRIRFSVADTGVGLSPEEVAKLGTKFWRAEDRFTRSKPGSGLGFSIASRLVEQMGSQIEVHSEKGKGSSFTFSVAIAAN